MKVRRGWSGEVTPNNWVKFDIELEQTDLDALLAEEVPGAFGSLTVGDAYRLLGVQAQIIMLSDVCMSIKEAGGDYEKVLEDLVKAKSKKTDIVEKLLKTYSNED